VARIGAGRPRASAAEEGTAGGAVARVVRVPLPRSPSAAGTRHRCGDRLAPERTQQGQQPDKAPSSRQRKKEPRKGDAPDRPAKQAVPPPLRTIPLVVFPDFRPGERTSEREAPELDRTPGPGDIASAARARSRQKTVERAPGFDWKRQRERALDRGTLRSFEGNWLHRYGAALEAVADKKPSKK
jgi:hypothetical protein